MSADCMVIFGAPTAMVDAYAQRLAMDDGALYLGDLNLAYADTVNELLQVFELSQIDLQQPLLTHLREHAGHADPLAFLLANRHWSLGELLRYLVAQSQESKLPKTKLPKTKLIFSDASAGLRLPMLDRWLDALPQALMVHATTDVAAFVAEATTRYAGRLFIPPDYLDHAATHVYPVFAPELAWYQMHSTLHRVLGEAADRRVRRIALDRDPPDSIARLLAAAAIRRDHSPAPSSIEALAHRLGYAAAHP